MKKSVKIPLTVLLVVLAVVWIGPLAFRGRIEQIVKREANALLQAELDFESLNISLLRHFPNASLELRGLTLAGAGRFAGDTIVAARRISVVVNPFSLLGDGGFVVKKVLLAAPRIHACKLADGAVNWDVMKPSDEAGEPAEEETGASSFKLAVRDFRISDAVVRYEDDSTRMAFSTDPLDLRLRGDLSAARSDLDLLLKLQRLNFRSGVVKLLSDATVELKASIDADLENKRFVFSKNSLSLNAITLTLDGWAQLLEGDAVAMDLKAGTENVHFKEVLSFVPAFYTRDFRQLTAAGELDLSLWVRGELRSGQLPAFELRTGVRDGRFQYASLPKAVSDIQLALRVANPGGPMDRTEVDLSKFGLRMANNAVAATFYGTNLVSDPELKASLQGRVDLGDIRAVYPLEDMTLAGQITADLKAAGRLSSLEKQQYDRFSASGTFVAENLGLNMPSLPPVELHRAAATITPAAMTLGELDLAIADSDLSATGQLSNYLGYLLRGDKLSGRLYVKSNLLNLNRLMPADDAAEKPAQPAASEPAAEAAPVALKAVAVPENLDLSLSTSLKKILFQQMTITDLAGGMRVANGALTLDNLSMGLFGGQASASGSYSTAADPARPQVAMKLGLKEASFQQTFKELELVRRLVPLFAKTGGDYSLALDLQTALDDTMSPDLQSVHATGELRSANIHLQNIEAFSALAKALKNDKLRTIEAKDVTIRFTIDEGRITTQPFDLKMGSTKMTLAGSTGLDTTIDYTATVELPEGAAGSLLSTVDVGIGGTFTSPKITLGVKKAAEQALKNALDGQVQKLTGSESLSAEVEKQAEKLRAEAAAAGAKLVSAAEAQRDKLVEEASKKGALAKIAAKKAGDKLVEEAEKKSVQLQQTAEEQIAKLTEQKKNE